MRRHSALDCPASASGALKKAAYPVVHLSGASPNSINRPERHWAAFILRLNSGKNTGKINTPKAKGEYCSCESGLLFLE
jgi:hypothetical protein